MKPAIPISAACLITLWILSAFSAFSASAPISYLVVAQQDHSERRAPGLQETIDTVWDATWSLDTRSRVIYSQRLEINYFSLPEVSRMVQVTQIQWSAGTILGVTHTYIYLKNGDVIHGTAGLNQFAMMDRMDDQDQSFGPYTEMVGTSPRVHNKTLTVDFWLQSPGPTGKALVNVWGSRIPGYIDTFTVIYPTPKRRYFSSPVYTSIFAVEATAIP